MGVGGNQHTWNSQWEPTYLEQSVGQTYLPLMTHMRKFVRAYKDYRYSELRRIQMIDNKNIHIPSTQP